MRRIVTAFDDTVVDGLAQPMADLIERWTPSTCYGAARLAFGLAALACLALALVWIPGFPILGESHEYSAATCCAAAVGQVAAAALMLAWARSVPVRTERGDVPGMPPARRWSQAGIRTYCACLFIAWFVGVVFTRAGSLTTRTGLGNLVWFSSALCALYLSACRVPARPGNPIVLPVRKEPLPPRRAP